MPFFTPAGSGASGGTSSTDDSAFTPGTSSLTPVGAMLDDTTPDSVDEGDVGVIRMSANRSLHTEIRDADGNERGLNVDANGRIGVTVNGTVTVDGSATTQPISHAALTELAAAIDTEVQVDVVSSALPSGAATAANQTTIIGHVDGIEALLGTIDADTGNIVTAVQLIDDAVYVDDADWTDSSSKHLLVGGLYQGTPQTVTDGDVGPFQIDSNGNLKVNIVAGAGSGGTAQDDDADFTAGTTPGTPAMGVYQSTPSNVTDGDLGIVGITQDRALRVNVDNSGDIGGGTQYTEDDVVPANPVGTAPVAQRDDALGGITPAEGDWTHLFTNANGALWVIHNGTMTVDGSGVTQPISASSLPLPTGAATSANQATIIGHVDGIESLLTTIDADTGGILTAVQLIDNAISGNEMQVDVAGALPSGTNTIGNVGLVGRTSGGMTIFRSIDIDESEEEIKSSAGQVFSISAFNTTAAPLYLKFYNATAANVTVGTTTPVLTFLVPGNADSDGSGFVWNNGIGFAFGTAITVACTTGVADNDTGAPGANACIVNVGYS